MASLKFAFANKIETATLKNGTGGGAPARDEVAPWVMEQAMNRDRGMPWQGGASLNSDFLLAASTDLELFAVLGHRGAPSTAVGIASVEVFTQVGAYTPGGTWTSRGTITLGSGVRDGKLLIAQITCDSVRYAITATTAFTIGRLWASDTDSDLLIVSSPGYSRKRIIQRIENRMGDGTPFFTQFGDPRWEYSLPYRSVTATVFNKLLQVGSQGRSFLMLDRDDTPFEAVVRAGTFEHLLKWSPADVHDAQLELETLP